MTLRTNGNKIRVPVRWNTVGFLHQYVQIVLQIDPICKGKLKINLTLELATKAQRGSRGIVVLFL